MGAWIVVLSVKKNWGIVTITILTIDFVRDFPQPSVKSVPIVGYVTVAYIR